MEGQNVAVQYFLPFTIAMIMLAMGLGLVFDDFRRIFEKPRAVVIGLGAQLVLLPVLGPLVRLATTVFATGGEVPKLPILDTTFQIFVIMAIPVVLGMLIRARSERWAGRLEKVVKIFAIVLLALIVVGSIARQSDNVVAFAIQAGVPVVVLNVVAMILGYWIAAGARLPRPQRRTITLEVGIQNGALAFALAAGLLQSIAVAIPAILYSILVYFTGAVVIASGRLRL
jgi:BASS family bile acid:Na+ symporter